MKTKIKLSGIKLLGLIGFLIVGFNGYAQKKWTAPASADKIVNPLKNDANAATSGKRIYKMLCVVCHGAKGKGDGVGGAGLTPKPTDLTGEAVQSQSDGAIFWKIEEGRSPMASYKTAIPENKRWEIINYIRTLKK